MQVMTAARMATYLEHTLLKPEATPAQIDALCDQAVEYGLLGVCVQPIFVPRVAARLASVPPGAGGRRPPLIVSVAGFPLGGSRTDTKADEARRAIDDGAQEIDMVVALGPLIAGECDVVREDIFAVAKAVHRGGGLLKVILETAVLPVERIILGCRLCAEAEADFVKTSTGLHPAGGARVEHVRLLHRHAAPIRVKAAGGIRTAEAALAMIEAGASRIGTSSGVEIVTALMREPA